MPSGAPSARPAWVVPAAILAAVGVVAGAFALLSGDGDGKDSGERRTSTSVSSTTEARETTGDEGEIFLELATDAGPDPFTADVAGAPGAVSPTTHAPTTTAGTTSTSEGATTTQPGAVAVPTVSGGEVGVYGGTLDDARCDASRLVNYLQQDSDRAAAWADVPGVEAGGIGSYVDALTPVTLQADTRVTNHSFADGRATARQSVLQAGTAVLVDAQGVPRVRCRCGNPLLEPEPVTAEPEYTGASWPGFDQASIQVVRPAPEAVSIFVLVDVATGALFGRPAGSDGEADRPPPSDTATTTPGASTTTVPRGQTTTTSGPAVPEPNAEATSEGSVDASSEFSGEFAASLAVDGDVTTSWFSAGGEGVPTFRWTGTRDDLVTLVRVIGNGNHPSYATGYGFESVTIRVLDAAGGVEFEQTVELPGTPDPTITVRPGVEGRSVELRFSGAESPSGGGFSELQVGVTR